MLKIITDTSPIPSPKSRSAKLFQDQSSRKISQKKTQGLKSCINPKTINKWKHTKLKTDFSIAPVSRNSKIFTQSNEGSIQSYYEDSMNCEDFTDYRDSTDYRELPYTNPMLHTMTNLDSTFEIKPQCTDQQFCATHGYCRHNSQDCLKFMDFFDLQALFGFLPGQWVNNV
jgi:hypothetical protein